MKKYRIAMLDHRYPWYKNPVKMDYAEGLKNARSVHPEIKVSYKYGLKCFTGWSADGQKEVVISEL